jgi:hypothetical protein
MDAIGIHHCRSDFFDGALVFFQNRIYSKSDSNESHTSRISLDFAGLEASSNVPKKLRQSVSETLYLSFFIDLWWASC